LARKLDAPEPNSWFPDLAFSLSVETQRSPPPNRPTVGVSPIAWLDHRFWPEKDDKRYEGYFGQLADFVRRLIARQNRVVLFATAAADHFVIEDLVRVLRASGLRNLDELLVVSSARTVPDLLNVLAAVDVVVASRLHGVLLAYACHLPVVALSYDRKVDYLVESLDQTDACLSIDTLQSERLLDTLDRVCAKRDAISKLLGVKVQAFRELLAEQYDRLFGPVVIDSPDGVEAATPR